MKNIIKLVFVALLTIITLSCEDKGLEERDWLAEPSFPIPMTLTPSVDKVVMTGGNDDANAVTFTWTAGNDRGKDTKLQYVFRMDISGNNFGEQTVFLEEIADGVLSKSFTVGELNNLLLKKFKVPGGFEAKLEVQVIAKVTNTPQFQKPEVATISFNATTFSPGPLPLYLVGDGISNGWNYNTGLLLNEVTERTTYTYEGNFTVGAFKVIEKKGSELPSYDPGTGSAYVYNQNQPRTAENVFKVTRAGRHTFYLDRDEKMFAFGYVPYAKVYMVGQAITGTGWNINNPKEMKWNPKNPEVFTFVGQLEPGETKLPLETGNWGGKFLMPVVNGTIIKGSATDDKRMKFVPNGNPDDKWVIETGGTYEVTVNPAQMTIVFKKL